MSIKKEDYLYLSALLSARETKLLSKEKAGRMLDAESFEEAAKLLTDNGYPDMSGMSAGEIEALLAKKRSAVFQEMELLAPDGSAVDVFRIRYDYHNAKVLVKAEAMKQDPERLMSASGRVAPDKLRASYTEGRKTDLPTELGTAMEEAKSILARTANPQLADLVLDRAYFAELDACADRLDSDFVRGYVRLLIDSANLKSAVRTIRMKKDSEFMRSVLIRGGNVDVNRIAAAGDKDSVAALFARGALAKAAEAGAAAAAGGGMTEFEKACDNAASAYLRSAGLSGYGVEPLISYLAGVESEMTTVRMILTGRLAGISSETIRERLRD